MLHSFAISTVSITDGPSASWEEVFSPTCVPTALLHIGRASAGYLVAARAPMPLSRLR